MSSLLTAKMIKNTLRKLYMLLPLLCLVLLANNAEAINVRIALTVNDKAIDNIDLEKRVLLVSLMAGIDSRALSDPNIRQSILDEVIKEEVKSQVISSLGIRVNENEIERAIDAYVQNANLNNPALLRSLETENLTLEDVRERLFTSIVWDQYIIFGARESLRPSKNEVKAALNERIDALGKRRYSYKEIVISTENDDDWRAKLREVQDLISRGVDFSILAQNFSSAASAQLGGRVTALPEDDIPENIKIILDRMNDGGNSQPIDNGENITFIQRTEVLEPKILRSKDSISYLSIDTQGINEETRQSYIDKLSDCRIAEILVRREGLKVSPELIDDLPRETEAVKNLFKETGTGDIIKADNNRLFLVCSREQRIAGAPGEKELEEILFQQRVQGRSEQLLSKYLGEAIISIF